MTPRNANDPEDQDLTVSGALDQIGLTNAHKIILLVVMAGGFFDVFEQNGAGVTGPGLREAWGITATQVSLVGFVTFFSMVIGGIATGIVADRLGRKTLFAFNLLVYSLGGLLCAFSPSYSILLVGRVIVGLALGGELTIALPYLSELMPTKFRGTAVSLFNFGAGGLGNPVSFMFGALVIGVMGPTLAALGGGWRWYFGLLALPALLVLYIRRNLPETPRFLMMQDKRHLANEALTRLASGSLKPVPEAEVHEYLDEHAAIAGHETSEGFLESLGALFRGKLLHNVMTVGLASFMSFGGQLAVLTLVPLILVERGFSITNSLGFTAVMQLGAMSGALAAALVNQRWRRRVVMTICGVMSAIFALLFGFYGTTPLLIMTFGFLYNFFVLMANTTIWAWAPELFPTKVRGTGTGLIVNSGMLGQAIMPVVAAGVYEATGIYWMFGMVAIMYGILVVLSLMSPETQGKSLDELFAE